MKLSREAFNEAVDQFENQVNNEKIAEALSSVRSFAEEIFGQKNEIGIGKGNKLCVHLDETIEGLNQVGVEPQVIAKAQAMRAKVWAEVSEGVQPAEYSEIGQNVYGAMEGDWKSPEFKEDVETAEQFIAMKEALQVHLYESEQLQQLVERAKKSGNYAEVNDLMRHIVIMNARMSESDTDKAVALLEDVLVPAVDFKMEKNIEFLLQSPEITAENKAILKKYPGLFKAVNAFYLKWYAINGRLDNELMPKQPELKQYMQGDLEEDDYTVVSWDSEAKKRKFRCVWADAFPKEIKAITCALNEIIAITEDNLPLQNYLIALRDAYAYRGDLQGLEAAWAKVDEKWLADFGQLGFTHGLEHYKNSGIIGPEIRLDYIASHMTSESGERVNMRQMTEESREALFAIAERNHWPAELIEAAQQKYENTNVQAVVPIGYGGNNFISLTSGQMGPNRLEVQEKGIKSIVEVSTEDVSEANVRRRLNNDTQADELLAMIPKGTIVRRAEAHETGHAIGWTKGVIDKLGFIPWLYKDEIKADALSIIINHEKDPKLAKDLAAFYIAKNLGKNTKYLNSYGLYAPQIKVVMSALHRAGMLNVDESEGLKINITDEGVEKWVEQLTEVAGKILQAYAHEGIDELNELQVQYIDDKFIEAYGKWVDQVDERLAA